MEDYKEKYEMALERAKQWRNAPNVDKIPTFANRVIDEIFPELKESGDERIRRNIIAALKGEGYYDCDLTNECIAWLEKQGNNTPTIIWHNIDEKPEEMKELFCEWESDDATWHDVAFYDEESHTFRHAKMPINVTKWVYVDELLEKQGEQKPVIDFKASNFYVSKVDGQIHNMTYNPANKVEPKFKVGNWIIFNGFIIHIDEVVDSYYRTTTFDGIPNSYNWDIDNVARLWTIKDAKDGDVLVVERDKTPFIFKEFDKFHPGCPVAYCGIDDSGIFVNSDDGWWTDEKVYPATKEQRELLFQKMKEAGWKWNDSTKELEKIKELKKINSYCQENCKGYQETDKCFADGECDAKRKAEQESAAWSDEDEEKLQDCIGAIWDANYYLYEKQDMEAWLKSLKDRIGG